MSIFVDANKTFPVMVKFKFVHNAEGAVTGVRILPRNAEGEGVQSIVCDAVGRDFDTMSKVMEDASLINHVTGKPMVRISVLCRMIILRFFRGWNIKDKKTGDAVPITSETLNSLRYEIVRAMAREWLLATGNKNG